MPSPFAPYIPSAQGGKRKSSRGWLGWMQPGVQALEDEYNRIYGGAVPRMAGQLSPNLGALWSMGGAAALPSALGAGGAGAVDWNLGMAGRPGGPVLPPPYQANFTMTEPGGPLVPTAGRNAMVPYRGTLPVVQRGPGISGPGYGAEAWTMSGAAGPAASGLSRFLGGAGRLAGRAIWPALIGKGLYDTYRTEMEGGPGTIKSYLKPYDPSDEAALAAQQEAIFGPAGSFPPIPQTQATPPSGRASGPFAPFLADRAQQAMPGGPKPRPHITERAAKVSGALTSAMKALAPPQAGEADLPGRAEALEAVSRALGGFMAPTPATPRTEANRGAQDQDVNWMQKAQMATPMPPEEVAALQQQYGQGPLLAQPAGYNYNPAMAGAIGRYGTSSRAIASPLTALESQPLDPNRPRLPIANLGVMSPEVARQRVEDREYEALMAAQRPERFYGAQTSYQNELDKVFGRAPGGGELPEGVPPREGFVANLRDRQSVAEEIARRRMIQDYTSQPRGTTMVGRVGTPATAEMLAAAALRPSRQERVAANRQRRQDALRGLTPEQGEAERTMLAGMGGALTPAQWAFMGRPDLAQEAMRGQSVENVARLEAQSQIEQAMRGARIADLQARLIDPNSSELERQTARDELDRVFTQGQQPLIGPLAPPAGQTPQGQISAPLTPGEQTANTIMNDAIASGKYSAARKNKFISDMVAKGIEKEVATAFADSYFGLLPFGAVSGAPGLPPIFRGPLDVTPGSGFGALPFID